MQTKDSIFKSSELEKQYMTAYEAVMALWPVPVEALDVPAPFGMTHVNISSVIYNPQRAYRRAIRLVPDLEAEIIPEASHALTLEKPGIVNARVLQFCQR